MPSLTPDVRLRPARESDASEIARLIRGLAEYEKLSHECKIDEPRLREHLFGARPFAEATLAEIDSRAVGYAIYFHNYSTFRAQPGLYLEDLFVEPDSRGLGIGKALLQRVIDIARERGCARVDWLVLDWNESAARFYKNAFSAEPMDGWTPFTVSLADHTR